MCSFLWCKPIIFQLFPQRILRKGHNIQIQNSRLLSLQLPVSTAVLRTVFCLLRSISFSNQIALQSKERKRTEAESSSCCLNSIFIPIHAAVPERKRNFFLSKFLLLKKLCQGTIRKNPFGKMQPGGTQCVVLTHCGRLFRSFRFCFSRHCLFQNSFFRNGFLRDSFFRYSFYGNGLFRLCRNSFFCFCHFYCFGRFYCRCLCFLLGFSNIRCFRDCAAVFTLQKMRIYTILIDS